MKKLFSVLFFTVLFAINVSAQQKVNGGLSIRGPIPYRDITAYMPVGGCDNANLSGGQEHGTINASSNSLTLVGGGGSYYANGCGVFVAGAGPLSTLSTPTQGAAPNPTTPVGMTSGSTTVHYKVAAIDPQYGTSAASAALTITTAPSTRTPIDYVGIYWTAVNGAVGYLVYTDNNGGGTYVPLGYSFDCTAFSAGGICGAIDKGVETNSWVGGTAAMWPGAPPGSVTGQALITTITSGGGTGALTLAATATTSVTQAFTWPDESMFIGQAISDANSDGDNSHHNKGTVFIPKGVWYTDTIPYPGGYTEGVQINLSGEVVLFGLPVYGGLASGGTGRVSISGHDCGDYGANNYVMNGCTIAGSTYLGALFVTQGSNSGLNLDHVSVSPFQGGIVQDSQGDVTTKDVNFVFSTSSTGLMLQIDNNVYFSVYDHSNWNDGANSTANNIPMIWFLGLTSTAHSSDFIFNNNTFVAHTVRMDQAFPGGGGPSSPVVFSGLTSIEDNWDPGFVTTATNNYVQSWTIDNVNTGDANAVQSLMYGYAGYSNTIAGNQIFVHGQTFGFSSLISSSAQTVADTKCFWVVDSENQPGAGFESLGYWGNIYNGTYTGCDYGITLLGPDVQTTEVLTSGGNSAGGTAGEQMIGHIIRRPSVTTSASSGSLSAATYYIKVTFKDVAGREGGASPEVSQVVGASGSVVVTATGTIYFPASCNVYYGTSAGGEANYFNSTTVTNGTCTYTLTTTSGASSGTPPPVGNAMNTWLTEENNANSCLYCGFSGGLGTGFIGFNLNAAQYAAVPSGVQFPFNGGVHTYKFFSGSETTAPTGASGIDQLWADSTAHGWKINPNNSGAQLLAGFGSTPTNGDCANISVVGGVVSLGDAGAACGASGGGLNTNMNNMANPTAMSQSLIPGAANSIALGSQALPFTNGFFGTVANQSGSFNTANLTANRVINWPDATSTTVRACASVSNQFLTAIAVATGICSQAQPTLANIAAGASPSGLFDFSGSTMKIPQAAGLFAGSASNIGLDTTAHSVHLYINNADSIASAFASAPTGSLCVQTSGTTGLLVEASGVCGTVTPSSTNTFTNKTLNAESTGNSLSEPIRAFFPAGGCNNSTAGNGWDIGVTNTPTPQCAGTTVRKGTLAFAQGNVGYINFHLPSDWNSSASTDIEICFTTTDTTNGHVTSFNIQTGFNATNGTVTDDPTLNTLQALSVTIGASQVSGGELCGKLTGMTMTGSAADYNFEIVVTRNNSGTDTNTDTAVAVKSAELIYGVTKNATNR
jgi:hypothetical protein